MKVKTCKTVSPVFVGGVIYNQHTVVAENGLEIEVIPSVGVMFTKGEGRCILPFHRLLEVQLEAETPKKVRK